MYLRPISLTVPGVYEKQENTVYINLTAVTTVPQKQGCILFLVRSTACLLVFLTRCLNLITSSPVIYVATSILTLLLTHSLNTHGCWRLPRVLETATGAGDCHGCGRLPRVLETAMLFGPSVPQSHVRNTRAAIWSMQHNHACKRAGLGDQSCCQYYCTYSVVI